MISQTISTFAPSQTMRRAMMSPMSPDPRITTRRPGIMPSMLTRRCAQPAVYTPAGRVPGMFSAPRVRSRQPMARTTALACTRTMPFSLETAVRRLSASTDRTMVLSITSMESIFSTSSIKRWAYSGPVSSWPK